MMILVKLCKTNLSKSDVEGYFAKLPAIHHSLQCIRSRKNAPAQTEDGVVHAVSVVIGLYKHNKPAAVSTSSEPEVSSDLPRLEKLKIEEESKNDYK
jgi:hypothetical protein